MMSSQIKRILFVLEAFLLLKGEISSIFHIISIHFSMCIQHNLFYITYCPIKSCRTNLNPNFLIIGILHHFFLST